MFNKKYSPYLFILPFFIMFVIFWIWPIIQSFLWSFQDWDGIRDPIFVGLGNYRELFRDSFFLTSLRNTVVAATVYIAVLLLIVIVLGLALNSKLLKGRNFFTTAMIVPIAVSLPVVALIFFIIYSPQHGVLNNILSFVGISPIDWLGNPNVSLWSIVIVRIWRAAGYYTIFIVAGLMAIPKDTIEAGLTDGANPWQMFRYILLPQLKPIIVFVTIASSVWAFRLFEEPWILTQGGPVRSTSTVAIHMYQNAFQFSRLGYASSSAYILTLIIIIFAVSNLIITKE